MIYIVLIIFLFSPVRIQPQETVQDARINLLVIKNSIDTVKKQLASALATHNATALKKQNYTDILQQKRARNDDLKDNHSELQKEYQACDTELKQCEDRTQRKNAAQYQQEIQATEKKIQEVLREKNDKISLLQKQKEEEKAVLKRLNDDKSKVNKLKNEKEKLLREIERCQTVSQNSTVFVPESSTSSRSTSIPNNFIDYKSSLLHNLLCGIFG